MAGHRRHQRGNISVSRSVPSLASSSRGVQFARLDGWEPGSLQTQSDAAQEASSSTFLSSPWRKEPRRISKVCFGDQQTLRGCPANFAAPSPAKSAGVVSQRLLECLWFELIGDLSPFHRDKRAAWVSLLVFSQVEPRPISGRS